MTRSSAQRSSAVQVEKSPPSLPSDGGPPSPPTSVVPWYWRLALFMWAVSYVCLLLYEWLAGIIKSWYAWRTGP